MPEVSVVCDNLDAGPFFFCDVGDIAFDAEKFLCLCLKIGIEDERFVFLFGLLDEFFPSAGLVSFKQDKGSLHLFVEVPLVLFVSGIRDLTDHGGILHCHLIAEAPYGLVRTRQCCVNLIDEARRSVRQSSPHDVAVPFGLQLLHVRFREHGGIYRDHRLGFFYSFLESVHDSQHRFSFDGVAFKHLMHNRKA